MGIDSIEEVRLFRQVVLSGSISAAARTLGDNKNRLSQRIRSLERALEVQLLDRTTRTLRLTEEGERFYAASEALVDAAVRAEAAVSGDEVVEGRVRVAIRSALSGVGMGEEIARLLSSTPKLRLQVVVVDNDADLLGLYAQGIDLAVQVGRLKDSTLTAKRLGHVPFAMCAAPSYLRAYGRPKTPGLGARKQLAWAPCGRFAAHPVRALPRRRLRGGARGRKTQIR